MQKPDGTSFPCLGFAGPVFAETDVHPDALSCETKAVFLLVAGSSPGGTKLSARL